MKVNIRLELCLECWVHYPEKNLFLTERSDGQVVGPRSNLRYSISASDHEVSCSFMHRAIGLTLSKASQKLQAPRQKHQSF